MGCEVPIVAKGMLENMLANEALGRGSGIPLSAGDWIKNGYHNMPPPSPQLFSGIKLQSVPLLQTNPPGSSSSTTASHSTMPILNSVPFSASRTFMNGFGGGLRVLSPQKNEEKPSCSNDLEIKKKKRNRNKVNGSNRKKPKTDSSSADLVLSNGDVRDEKLPSSRSRKRVASTDRAEKTSAKRQSSKGIKDSENDAEHRGVPLNESSLKDSTLQGSANSGSSGILDIYGLKTRPINLSNRILDVSINDLLSGKFQAPPLSKLGNEGKHSAVGDSLVKEVDKILQVMPKPIHAEDNKLKMENSTNMGIRSQLHESRRGPQYPAQRLPCEVVACEEPRAMKFAASSDSPFPVGMFPSCPMEDFVSWIELPSDEPLEKLPVKPDRQPDIGIEGNLHVHSNGSIPPLQHSTSLTGGSRPSLKRDKESKHGSFWLKAGIVKCANVSCGFGSGCKLESESNADVECEQAQRERPNRHTGRALMIDLNLQSSEQLLESSMLDSPNSSLFPKSIEEPSGLSLHNRASEGREGEANTGECIESVYFSSRVDHSIPDDESLKRTSVPSEKERDSEQALHLETHRSHRTNIKNDIGITFDFKTIKAPENFERPNRDEDFKGQRQQPNNLKEVQAPFVSDKNASQMNEAAQHSLSDLPALQIVGDKVVSSTGMPATPRVEAAARILFDMANLQSHFSDKPQEDLCHLSQQECTRSSTIGQRHVNVKTISHGDFKAVEEYKDTEIKAPTNEKKKSRMSSSIPLVGKHSPKETDPPCQFQNRTFDTFLRKNKPKQGLRDVRKHEFPDAKEANDFHIHGPSSRSSKPTTDDADIGPVLCTSNQKRGNLQPKSLTKGKMHVSSKSNQNSRTNNVSHKSAHFEGQNQRRIGSSGHIKSPRPIISFTDRKR